MPDLSEAVFNKMRKFPEFKGKGRLSRFLLGDKIESLRDIVVKGRRDCIYLLPNLKENVGFDIFINGIYERESSELLERLLPEKGTFLDIGGNIGAISIPICKIRPDVKAFAVEAAPWIFAYLKRNVEGNNLTNLKLFNFAVYDENGIEVDFYCPSDVFGKGSMAAVFTSKSVKVKTITIDDLVAAEKLEKVDLMKVDVEGFEYFVFKGGKALLEGDDAPVIYFEFIDWAESSAKGLTPGAAQQLLREYGYHLYKAEGNKIVSFASILEKGSFNILASKKKLRLA